VRGAFVALVLTLLAPAAALSHAMPNSTVRLSAAGKAISAKIQIPLSELEAAIGRPVTAAQVSAERSMLEAYLRDHMELKASDGRPWGMRIEALSAIRDHDHDLMEAKVRFSPPAGADQGIALVYDAVLHKVASHYALVYLDAGAAGEIPLARLQSPTIAVVVAEPAAPPSTPKRRFSAPDLIQWVYLAGFLGALAIAVRGYMAWRGRTKGNP
jgi:hypothetical protein